MNKIGSNEKSARALVARDLTLARVQRDLQKYQEELSEDERLSLVDSLTGLPNHRALFGDKKANPPLIGRLEEFISHAERSKEPFAIAMLDLDKFKQYNDDFGHPAGNVALQELARVIRRVIRPSDFAARFGGEEFLVILPGLDQEQARIVIERLRQAVAEMPFQGSKGKVDEGVSLLEKEITISAGLTDYTDYSKQDPNINMPDVLVQNADDLLYLAKNTGRNRVVSRDKSE
ncbi:GGDEF domain-containing protein [Candidatus Roizmanbacteria bacterium]|nr:GGDEF domain-containing protein [Candidatus Roizmanbacteria bacterium]